MATMLHWLLYLPLQKGVLSITCFGGLNPTGYILRTKKRLQQEPGLMMSLSILVTSGIICSREISYLSGMRNTSTRLDPN